MQTSLPNLKARMQALIATPSVSAVSDEWDMSNRPVIDLLASWFETLGFSVVIQPVGDADKNKANMIATLGSGAGGLVLAGHTDTVPFNESRWQHNPLSLTEADDRFYGLGTCDMKCFFALIIEAVLPLLDQPLKQPLIVLATCDEESTMRGAKSLTEQSLGKPRAAMIGEPTSLKPIRMHKGIMMEAITVTGQSGHSSNPELGHNALDAIHDMITELKTLRTELKDKYQNPAFAVNYPTMNLGCIHGGDNPNRICNSCELHFDFRGLPGMQNEEIRQLIMQRLQPIADQHQVTLDRRALFDGVEAFEQAEDSELVQLVESLTGSNSEAVAFGTEAPYLKNLGIDTVVMGPGSIDQAHQPNEFIAFDQIKPSTQLIQAMIRNYCL
ncbi:Acetylornithine deacetylase [BD1-7 clade bacterium]|uniref:Acetylornithine deacetylase n=1 Tax=BD1-7 clade bacterium TaxID=2029982 RepID=A0A5S9QV00_9GAMM|nr:Acetylornithine deacetylase [BD1-7 clade bacterium]CAA0122209.1 Acetylornithine deacetylase [BD1-7 clade bacterium]